MLKLWFAWQKARISVASNAESKNCFRGTQILKNIGESTPI